MPTQRWTPRFLATCLGRSERRVGSRDPRERTADQFFAALGALCAEELPLPSIGHLPRSRSTTVRAAIDSLRDDHADATIERAERRGTSTRTPRRKLHDELGTSFREFSSSTFTRRFTRFAGELPSSYRARIRKVQRAP